MDSQQATTDVTKTTELIDLEDRSRFLKSLGFARDRMVQGNAAVQNNQPSTNDDGVDDDGMVLSSNFEDDLDLPGSPVLMDPTRSLSEPFGLGKIDLGDEPADEGGLEIETRFAEETSFDIAGVDDAAWDAVSYRLRPEPTDWKEAEAILEADLKKKTVPTGFSEPMINSVSESRNNPKPPPLLEDDDVDEILVESNLDQEIEKAVEPPSNDDEPPRDESLTVNCPSCERGLTLQPEHLGIPGCCVWCETPIIAATSGVDHTVGVFELAFEKPNAEEVSVTPPKPTAETETVVRSKLADLPTAKASPPQLDAPIPETVETEKVEEPEEKPPVASIQAPEVKAELPPKTEEQEDAPADIETVTAIPEPKNNFPWNAPTTSKKGESVSKLVPPPIEVESELLLDEITDPEPQETADKAPSTPAVPFEVISEPKAEKKKEPLPPIDSPLPELDTAALSSWTAPAAPPIDQPAAKEETSKRETPATEPVQAASPFGSPVDAEKADSTEKAPPPIKAVSPFDPIPNTAEAKAPTAPAEESKPTSFSAASPFGSPKEEAAKTEVVSSDPAEAIAPTAPAEEAKPTSFTAASPFGSPKEEAAKTEVVSSDPAETKAPMTPTEESKPTSFSAASPFGSPIEEAAKAETAPSDSAEATAPAEETKPASFSAASPFGSPIEEAAKTETAPSDSAEAIAPAEETKPASFSAASPFGSSIEEAAKAEAAPSDPAAPAEETNPSSFSAASPFGPPKEAAATSETSLPTDPAPQPAATTPEASTIDSATPEAEAASASPLPLPWDRPNEDAPTTELPAVKPEYSDEDGPPVDYPENEGPPMDGPSAATVSTTIEKPVRRKKSGSSKNSRAAITIALLGLISGAGIASFFLPIGGYIEKAKSSWTEWFETKIGVENSWDQEAQPSPANEPVAIPAPASDTEASPPPEVAPPARTAIGDEPDPFESNKAPGS